jgi:hypothetical protein
VPPVDPPTFSYIDALFAALRGAGQRLAVAQRWLGSAEDADDPSYRLQALAAARAAHAEACVSFDDAAARLRGMEDDGELPPPFDQLPPRLEALQAELHAADERLLKLAAETAAHPVGDA